MIAFWLASLGAYLKDRSERRICPQLPSRSKAPCGDKYRQGKSNSNDCANQEGVQNYDVPWSSFTRYSRVAHKHPTTKGGIVVALEHLTDGLKQGRVPQEQQKSENLLEFVSSDGHRWLSSNNDVQVREGNEGQVDCAQEEMQLGQPNASSKALCIGEWNDEGNCVKSKVRPVDVD